jgi:uncharacterized membrane protein (UPF0127 family)
VAGTTEEEARRLRRVKRGFVGALAVVLLVAGCRAATPPGRVTVLVDGRSLSCDLADTRASRERGLQGYGALEDGRGMLFVNEAPAPVSIEMKSVRFPIDVAFVDSELRVMKIASLYPDAAREVSTSAPALYVIETPQGWLDDNDIGVGSSHAFLGSRP